MNLEEIIKVLLVSVTNRFEVDFRLVDTIGLLVLFEAVE